MMYLYGCNVALLYSIFFGMQTFSEVYAILVYFISMNGLCCGNLPSILILIFYFKEPCMQFWCVNINGF